MVMATGCTGALAQAPLWHPSAQCSCSTRLRASRAFLREGSACRAWLGRSSSGSLLQSPSQRAHLLRQAGRRCESTRTCAMAGSMDSKELGEVVFFDGGPHFGDLIVNILFGLTGVWLPLTLAAVLRSLNFRYRFTDRRFILMSGPANSDRRDFPYSAITDVKLVPRFIGEWGDIAITLSDKSVIDLKAVPKFREIAQFCRDRMSGDDVVDVDPMTKPIGSKGFGSN